MSRYKSTGKQRFCLGQSQDRRLNCTQTSLAVKHNEVGGARHGRCHACHLLVCTAGRPSSVPSRGFSSPAWPCICLKVAEASASVIKSAWRAPSFSTSFALVSVLLSPLSHSGEAAGLTFSSIIRLRRKRISVGVNNRGGKGHFKRWISSPVTMTAGNQGKVQEQFVHDGNNSNTETNVSFIPVFCHASSKRYRHEAVGHPNQRKPDKPSPRTGLDSGSERYQPSVLRSQPRRMLIICRGLGWIAPLHYLLVYAISGQLHSCALPHEPRSCTKRGGVAGNELH